MLVILGGFVRSFSGVGSKGEWRFKGYGVVVVAIVVEALTRTAPRT